MSPELSINNNELVNSLELFFLEKIFRGMGIGRGTEDLRKYPRNYLLGDVRTAFEQDEGIEELIRLKGLELENLPGWVKEDKKELIRDKMPLVFLQKNQLPILRRAGKDEIRALGIRKMTQEMGRLRNALAAGGEQEILNSIGNTIDVIEEVLYPGREFSIGTFSIDKEDLDHWVKKVFFWINQDRYNPHGMSGVLRGVIWGFVSMLRHMCSREALRKI